MDFNLEKFKKAMESFKTKNYTSVLFYYEDRDVLEQVINFGDKCPYMNELKVLSQALFGESARYVVEEAAKDNFMPLVFHCGFLPMNRLPVLIRLYDLIKISKVLYTWI